MADSVQHFLEAMVPELEEWEVNGLFNKEEIASVIKQRRDHEYAIKRPGKEKVDFLRYLNFELQLDTLRRLRQSRLGVTRLGSGADTAGVRHMHVIFRRALLKFRSDLRLWLQYIDFCLRVGSARILGRIFAEALGFHPHHESLWILAASWEFRQNANMAAARVILQRAIRLNPRSAALYLEYARLELLYASKLRTRLGLEQPQPAPDSGVELNSLPGQTPRSDSAAFLALEGQAPTPSLKGAAEDPLLQGAVALLVFRAAVEARPDDWQLRLHFRRLLALFPGTRQVVAAVDDSLREDFPTHPEALVALALEPVRDALARIKEAKVEMKSKEWQEEKEKEEAAAEEEKEEEEAVGELAFNEDFISSLRLFLERANTLLSSPTPSPLVRVRLIRFALEQRARLTVRHHENTELAAEVDRLLLLAITELPPHEHEVAEDQAVLEALLLEQTRVRLVLGRPEALTSLRRALGPSSSSSLWSAWVALHGAPGQPQVESALRTALSALGPIPHSLPLRMLLVRHLLVAARPRDQLLAAVQAALPIRQSLLVEGSAAHVADFRLELLGALESASVEDDLVRPILTLILEHPPVTPAFFRAALAWEKARQARSRHVESLLRRATDAHGSTEHVFWLMWVRLAQEQGDLSRAQALYYQAKQTLTKPEAFLAAMAASGTGVPQ